MLYHSYNIIIDCDVGSPVNGKDAVDGFNSIVKMKEKLYSITAIIA